MVRVLMEHTESGGFRTCQMGTFGDSTTLRDSSASRLDACTPPRIKYWLRQIKLGRIDLQTQDIGGPPPLDDIDAEIISVLRKFPFSPLRTIPGSVAIPASMIYTHLVEKIDLKNCCYLVGFPTD
jgi:hypothetical protein